MKKYLFLSFSITFAAISILGFPNLAEAQTRTFKMPHDGYVCFKRSIIECATSVLGSDGYATVFKTGVWEVRDGTLFLTDPITPYIRAANEKIGCFSRHNFLTLDKDVHFNRVLEAQVFSVEIFLRFSEAWIQFERAAKDCRNIVNKAEKQAKAYSLQLAVIRSESQYQQYSSEMENFGARMSLLRDKNYCYSLPMENLINRCLGEVRMPATGRAVEGMDPLLLHNALTSSRVIQADAQFQYRKYLLDAQEEELAVESDRLTKNFEAAGVELARARAAIVGAIVRLPEGAKIRKVLADEGIPLLKGDLVFEYRR
jgi:hypothetical protein